MATTELTAQPGATPPASKPPANLLSVGLVESFNRLPNRSKLTVMVVLAALFAMGIATFMWSRIPTYRVLFTNLSDRDGGAIVSALTQMNVPYKFAEGGGALLVPQESVHEVRLRLASQGLPRGGNVGFEMMESAKFGITQFQEQVNYQRALEGELARSIESLSAVQSARVHLAIPKSSVFLREQQKPTASVLLSLYANKTLDRAQVSGIVHLVSSSVPELTTKNVSVVDQHGSLLSSEAANDGRFDATQLAYVQQVEAGFQKRIGEILEPMLGRQNFRAQVAADIDFTQSESTDERYKPNRNPAEAAVRSEQLGESASNGQPIGPLGIPGALSNQPPVPTVAPIVGAANGTAGAQASRSGTAAPEVPTAAVKNPSTTQKNAVVNYEVDKLIRHTRAPTGTIRRLSAAVVINHKRVAGAEGKSTSAALSDKEIEQVVALVKEAMGYREDRGDTLKVSSAPFTEAEEPAVVPLWKRPETIQWGYELARNILLPLFVFLMLLLFAVRPLLKSIAQAQPPAPLPSPDVREIVGEIESTPGEIERTRNGDEARVRLEAARRVARQDPKLVASVVRNWVSGNE